jgi:methyl-accepting chemotaxis protein
MPTPIRAGAKGSLSASKPTSYVKFSDKLTQSIDDIQKIIESHKQMIDSIQEIALELTSSIGTLHTLTVKYARTANQILDVLLPIVKNLPLIPKNVIQMLVNLEAITQKIINNEASTSKTITDVRGGLQTGDVNKLKAHAGQLQNVTKTITSIIPKG